MKNSPTNKDVRFMVYGIKHNANPLDGGAPTVELEMIGSFAELSEATFCRDLYSDVDTTFEAVNVTAIREFSESPNFDVMLKIVVSPDGKAIDVDSMCVPGETSPWLITESDRCEALAYPEDMDYVLDLMKEWALEHRDVHPTVNNNISPVAQEMIDN